MRLTKYDKEAFVRAVMNDVPRIDYREQAQKLFDEWLVTKLPAEVAAVFKRNDLQHYLESFYVSRMPLISHRQIAACGIELDDAIRERLEALDQLDTEQCDVHEQLKDKVTAVIYGCSTLKTATERLPEFVKYLPADRDGTGVTNLPAISNIVASLVAAGWPKQQTQGASHGA